MDRAKADPGREREILSLNDAESLDDLGKFIDGQEIDAVEKQKMQKAIQRAADMVNNFFIKRGSLPDLDAFLRKSSSPLKLFEPELKLKIVELLSKETRDNQEVIGHNLGMLNRDMLRVLLKESMGGEAGSVEIDGKTHSCLGANGLAEPITGSIIAFGNPQETAISQVQIDENASIQLKVAFLYHDEKKIETQYYKIIDFSCEHTISPKGLKNLDVAMERYNSEQESK